MLYPSVTGKDTKTDLNLKCDNSDYNHLNTIPPTPPFPTVSESLRWSSGDKMVSSTVSTTLSRKGIYLYSYI